MNGWQVPSSQFLHFSKPSVIARGFLLPILYFLFVGVLIEQKDIQVDGRIFKIFLCEASTSTIEGNSGLGWCRTGTEVKDFFSWVNAHLNLVVYFLMRQVMGYVMVEKLLMTLR